MLSWFLNRVVNPGLVSMRLLFVGGLTTGMLLSSLAQAKEIDEGIEYQLVTPPVRTVSKNKVEVVELFWYGCPHCYSFEPKLIEWKKKLGKNVQFIRIPAIFPHRPTWELHARAYYAAELLGVLDKIHAPLFTAIQKDPTRMPNREKLASFFEKYGVKKAVFLETLDSFGVQMKVNRAKYLTGKQGYKIDGVPTIIVDGRYRTHASLTNGQAGMLKVTDYLIKKASKSGK